MEILRCVEPGLGLIQHRLYEVVRRKRHPLFDGIPELLVVREYPTNSLPVPDDPNFGYRANRFIKT